MTRQESLSKFGYKFGKNGAHSARSMMLEELRSLFQATAPDSTQEHYQSEICDHNLLDKPTVKSRKLSRVQGIVAARSRSPARPSAATGVSA